jgi:probable F420-dependent oxidoreductase
MREVRFGVTLGIQPPDTLRALAARIEALGYDSIWSGDHLQFHNPTLESLTTLSHLAAVTRRVSLGTAVYLLALRHPTVAAKTVATLDVLSGGRVVFGVGVGGEFPKEFEAAGVPHRERGRRVDEGIEVCRLLWTTSPAAFEGRFVRFTEVALEPKPVQPGGPPIWIGGRSEPAVRRAGRLAAAYQSSSTPPDAYAERIPILRAAAEAAGRPMPGLSARVVVRFDEVAPPSGYVVSGDDDAIARELQRFIDLGVEHLLVAFGEVETPLVVAAMERFDREVRPRLTAAAPAVAGAA